MTPTTNFFIDAPNVDFVLGDILGRPPSSHERPRWDAIKHNLSRTFSIAGRPDFVLNRRHFTDRLYPFARAIRGLGYHLQVVDKVGDHPGNEDPVDEFILDNLRDVANASTSAAIQVAVMSHDHIYAPYLKAIAGRGGRVVICGFREELSPALLGLESCNCEILDLEHDLGGFNLRLPRPYRPDW